MTHWMAPKYTEPKAINTALRFQSISENRFFSTWIWTARSDKEVLEVAINTWKANGFALPHASTPPVAAPASPTPALTDRVFFFFNDSARDVCRSIRRDTKRACGRTRPRALAVGAMPLRKDAEVTRRAERDRNIIHCVVRSFVVRSWLDWLADWEPPTVKDPSLFPFFYTNVNEATNIPFLIIRYLYFIATSFIIYITLWRGIWEMKSRVIIIGARFQASNVVGFFLVRTKVVECSEFWGVLSLPSMGFVRQKR